MTGTLNRSAFLVRFREPYLEWGSSIDSEAPSHLQSYKDNVSVFLVSEDPKGVNESAPLKGYYEKIFENELETWCPDDSRWPQKRTFKMFNEWFNITVQGIVTDLENRPLEAEDL